MRSPLIALAAMTMIASVPAAAEEPVVRYNDLNLASPSGQKALDRRIDAAARSYCGIDDQQTGSRIKRNGAQCFREARAAAREQMATLIENKASKGG
jgi:UrcA family protein